MYPPLNVPVPTESWPDDPILGFGLVQLNTLQSNQSGKKILNLGKE